MQRLVSGRFGGIAIFFVLFLAIGALTRTVLLATVLEAADLSPAALAGVYSAGLVFDLATAALMAIPAWIYLTVVPEALFGSRWHRALSWLVLAGVTYGLLFTATAEWFFWDEFGTRFNFIAVDYLVYTTEVVGNIRESYPVGPILAVIALVTLVLMVAVGRSGWLHRWHRSRSAPLHRIATAGLALALTGCGGWLLDNQSLAGFDNRYDQELSRNGTFSFFAAFRNNELRYDDFYLTEDRDEAYSRLHRLIGSADPAASARTGHTVRHTVDASGTERRFNIIQITVESLSAKFLGAYGNTQGLTPNLDRLAAGSMLFTNLYATGTRTVRGMESLTLSVPPTPGRSIVKRPDNDHLFTLGTVLRERGYRTQFIYGGYGYFDNMNAYFEGNDYEVIDRSSVDAGTIGFANVWGASDEDLYGWALDAADRAHADGQPFHQFVMTTSNHRPYTYPAGRIDIPSHSGRDGAVKYTDYAIGDFIEKARSKPWFDDTLFVIVADHCAGSAGKTAIPLENYHIPMLIYGPALVKPARIDTLASQVDVAPTLLGLMNLSYESQFYGRDILRTTPADQRLLVGTYQNLGYFKDDVLTILQPRREVTAMRYSDPLTPTPADPVAEQVADAIALYQTAAERFGRDAGS